MADISLSHFLEAQKLVSKILIVDKIYSTLLFWGEIRFGK